MRDLYMYVSGQAQKVNDSRSTPSSSSLPLSLEGMRRPSRVGNVANTRRIDRKQKRHPKVLE